MTRTLLFKKGDFKLADFFNPQECPIHRALRREYPDSAILVGGKTITVSDQDSTQRFQIGEVRMNGSLMSLRGLSTPVLSHIHNAIRWKHFKNAGVELVKL